MLRRAICQRPSKCAPIPIPFRAGSLFTRRPPAPTQLQPCHSASTSSSTRWKSRQSRDAFAREARVAGLKSRAAFKLLEIDAKHRLFRRGDTVVDLGYAPGSWSQVAVTKTAPGGRVVGIDVIPSQPPRGANALQGNFLSPETQARVREFVLEQDRGRGRERVGGDGEEENEGRGLLGMEGEVWVEKEVDGAKGGVDAPVEPAEPAEDVAPGKKMTPKQLDMHEGRVVDVVLSDMSEPWPLVTSTWIKSISNPYLRMMNTSGMAFRDHAGSMDLCFAALTFCYDTLRTGGHFLCKYYAGSEDHAYEMRLKKLFDKVHRIKPDSSRKESKEAYFVALRRKPGIAKESVLGDAG